MIYVTGDTHGENDIAKLNARNFDGKGLTKKDYVIILGDFGFIWKNEPDKTEEYWLKWFNEKPWTTLFLDGNHENFARLNAYPVEQWKGGKIHRITDSVIHLMRGQVFTLEDKTFFTFGGAKSIDAVYRTPNISWWEEEIPNYAEVDEGFKNLLEHNNKVDYVLTHTCISDLVRIMVQNDFQDPTNKVLDAFHSVLDFKKWYFGHWHIDRNFGRYETLYDTVKPLDKI